MKTHTLQLKLFGRWLELPLIPFVNGIKKVGSGLLGLHQDTDSTIRKTFAALLVSTLLLHRRQKSLTAGSAANIKKKTLNDRSILSDTPSLLTLSLKTLALALTGKEKVLKPFWNNAAKELSQKLWLPTGTDFVDSASSFSSTSLSSLRSNSLFSTVKMVNPAVTTSPQTSFPSFTCIPAEKWVEDGTVTRKIKLNLTTASKQTVKKWAGTTRKVYNTALSSVKEGVNKPHFQTLRNKFVTEKGNKDTIPSWQFETPKDIRAGAVKDLETGFKAAFTNLGRGNIDSFNMNFRSKRNTDASMSIPKSAVKISEKKVKKKRQYSLTIYSTYLKQSIKVRDKAFKRGLKIDRDCRLQYKDGQWYLCVPTTVKTRQSKSDGTVCALDPGEVNFQTIYSEKEAVKVSKNEDVRQKLCLKIDRLRSLRDRKQITKYSYRIGRQRLQRRLNNLVDDIHSKTINYLVDNYKFIYLPSFESQELVRKNRGKKFRRSVLSLKHFRFKQRLLHKAKKVENCTVRICTEEYTSCTCTGCGKVKRIGGVRVYNCESCGLTVDRDVNGARNILLKCISSL